MFSGDQKDLLSFPTKYQIKFDGRPSCFPDKRSTILYMGSCLEGPVFSWFQPLIAMASDTTKPALPKLASFKVISNFHTIIYENPNLEVTAVQEIRHLHQTGSAAEYAVRIESKKKYMQWNDKALQDQFYLNLKEELNDEIAPVSKPKT
jgi:hypothetical protein